MLIGLRALSNKRYYFITTNYLVNLFETGCKVIKCMVTEMKLLQIMLNLFLPIKVIIYPFYLNSILIFQTFSSVLFQQTSQLC